MRIRSKQKQPAKQNMGGIKRQIAVDAPALDFGRTYCGNASMRRGQ